MRPEQERRRSASRRRLVGRSLACRHGRRQRKGEHRRRRRVGPLHARFRVQRDVVVVVRHDLVVVVMPVGRRPGQSRGVVLVPGREEVGCQVQPGSDRKRTRSLASEQDDHRDKALERSAHGRDCDRPTAKGQRTPALSNARIARSGATGGKRRRPGSVGACWPERPEQHRALSHSHCHAAPHRSARWPLRLKRIDLSPHDDRGHRHDVKLLPGTYTSSPRHRLSPRCGPRCLRRRLSTAARDGADPLHRNAPRRRVGGSLPLAGGRGQHGDPGLHRPAERVRRADRRRAAGTGVGEAATGRADRHAFHRFAEQGGRLRALHVAADRRGTGVHRAPTGAGGCGRRALEDRSGWRLRGRGRPDGSGRRVRPPRHCRRFA